MSSKAYIKAMTLGNLISVFQKAGIYPFNRDVVTNFKLAPSTIYPAPEKERQMTNETNTERDTVNQNDTHVIQEQNRNNTIQEKAEVSENSHNVEPGLNTTKKDEKE